jgi:hypothetical protein
MRNFLTAGLLSLTLLAVGVSQARADGGGWGFSWHASGSFGINFGSGCGGGGCCPDPYAGCAYAPYFQYGWPQSVPVYPGVAPGYGFAPTPWSLPPSPYIGPYFAPQAINPPYYWSRR